MRNVWRGLGAVGAVFAGLWVAVSAAAAHLPALQQGGASLSAALSLQAVHALGLVVLGVLQAHQPSRWWLSSAALMLAGLLLFCLNIQARLLWGWDAARALVPAGGSAFMLAWLVLAVGALRLRR